MGSWTLHHLANHSLAIDAIDTKVGDGVDINEPGLDGTNSPV